MTDKIEHIGKRDIAWSYAATILGIGAGVILWPFILNKMSAETVGIWNILSVIALLVSMLDFGFRPSFSRNISYIFSGVRTLQQQGVAAVTDNESIDYALLKGTLAAMRQFYRRIALVVFIVLSTAGTAYFYFILQKYSGNRLDAAVAWLLMVIIKCYDIYTYYYDALLLGKGYIRRNQQITILGQIVYLSTSIGLIYAGLGLSAIVSAQLLSTIIRRVLTYKVFFTRRMKQHLAEAKEIDTKIILHAIMPNAIKIGLTSIGGFMVNKSTILIGSAFLGLEQMGSYGFTLHLIDVLAQCSKVNYFALSPRLAQCRANKDIHSLRRYYLQCVGLVLATYAVGSTIWLLLGDWALQLISSSTTFLPHEMLCTMLFISMLEQNHIVASGFISADNRIPFFIPSLLSGAGSILLLWLLLDVFPMGIWGLIIAPGIAQLVYQNWKWPSVIIHELYKKTQ